MPILHLGVIDNPYNEVPPPGKRRRKKVVGGTQTTGDVAGWLENRYHVMEIFYEQHAEDVVAPALENSLAGALESVLMGAPASLDPFGGAMSVIEDRFRAFLTAKEMDALGYPGIPTKASLLGISRRFKNRRSPGRPSFIDTSLYSSSMKAWVE
jgi:hypothetical protein